MASDTLDYLEYTKIKIADAAITYSLSQIEESFARFMKWKSAALLSLGTPEPPLSINDLDTTLGQLDLIISSKPSILLGKESKFAFLLSQAVRPLSGEWIWYKQELTEMTPKWAAQRNFVEEALPLLLVVSIKYFTKILETKEDSRISLFTALCCYLYKGYPWSDSIPANITKALNACAVQVFDETPGYFDILFIDVIKPTFSSAATHKEISAAGRKVFTANDEQPRLSHAFSKGFMDDPSFQKDPWKESRVYVISLLEVYLRHTIAVKSTTQTQWSFFVPCVLNIIDYHNPAYKCKGADLLVLLIDSVSEDFFKKTGVATVFWEALKPSLTFLPPSTPISIAVPLSKSTFEAMIKLSYLNLASKRKTSDDKKTNIKPISIDLQEEYLLEGIFRGVSHTNKSPEMVTVFINSANILVLNHLKTYTTPHLKPLIGIVVGTLCDPFISYAPELMSASAKLLQTLIRAVWFRIPYYRYDILRGVIMASRRIIEEKNDGLIGPSEDLRESVKMLEESVRVCMKQKLDSELGLSTFQKEIEILESKEPSFKELMKT
ncbi:uncharacterized protein SAPINGB_P002218 [Magnusiomyces paraingens]|uniref:Pre-rRNA-processing protein RIX1 n=1 Tax=Magnusiomyces paraingens TaxID=2606893 RepID=A0A5E8BF00_9ASCO|nr:uncharacterized protein SAPINGB_P002218 [Saprochaete ingens]VVT49332.1 unnamed protein product [Saprochaete ingens]